jgi:hypothetical protein
MKKSKKLVEYNFGILLYQKAKFNNFMKKLDKISKLNFTSGSVKLYEKSKFSNFMEN